VKLGPVDLGLKVTQDTTTKGDTTGAGSISTSLEAEEKAKLYNGLIGAKLQ
jgi:hypothetical protein